MYIAAENILPQIITHICDCLCENQSYLPSTSIEKWWF